MTSPMLLGLGKWLQLSLALCAISVSSSNEQKTASNDDESTEPLCGVLVQSCEHKYKPSEESSAGSETIPLHGVPLQPMDYEHKHQSEENSETRPNGAEPVQIEKGSPLVEAVTAVSKQALEYKYRLIRDGMVWSPQKDLNVFPPNIRLKCWENCGKKRMSDEKIHNMKVTKVLGFFRKAFSYWPQNLSCITQCAVSCFTNTIGVSDKHWGIYAECEHGQGKKKYYFRLQLQNNQVSIESVIVPIGKKKKPNRIAEGAFHPKLMTRHPYTHDVDIKLGTWLNHESLMKKDGFLKEWQHKFWKAIGCCTREAYVCQDFVIDSWKIMGSEFVGVEFDDNVRAEQHVREDIEQKCLATQWCVDVPRLSSLSEEEKEVYQTILQNEESKMLELLSDEAEEVYKNIQQKNVGDQFDVILQTDMDQLGEEERAILSLESILKLKSRLKDFEVGHKIRRTNNTEGRLSWIITNAEK